MQPIEKLAQWDQQAAKPFEIPTQRSEGATNDSQKAKAEIAGLVSDLLQLLRLYCCSFRRSLRHATKGLHGQMKLAKANEKQGAGGVADAGMDSVLGLVLDLVQVTSNAVRAVEMVSLLDLSSKCL